MKRPFTRKTPHSQEGVYMVLMSGLMIGFVVLLGLAVDSANLYRAQLRLQRAVDAGAIGGTYLISTAPGSAESVARNIAQDNIAHMGLGNFPATTLLTGNQLTVQGAVNVPLWFMQMVPGIGSTKTVSANAQAESVQTVVSLVLDRTASMNCPISGACNACMSFPNDASCHPSKLDKLKESAIAFVNLFQENTDQLAMVSFSNTATPNVPMGPLSKGTMTAAINSLVGLGSTNIQGGIAEGQAQLANAIPGYRKVIVLVTDGAPSVDGSPILMGCPAGANPTTQQKRYIRTIVQADAARAATNTSIYTIGLGQLAGEGTDPYQDATDAEKLKSYLLRRVANSEDAASDPLFDCAQSYANYNSTPGIPKGTYLGTPDANQLQSLLVSVGKSIKARMVQ